MRECSGGRATLIGPDAAPVPDAMTAFAESQQWSTAHLPPQQRLEYWMEVLSRQIVPMEVNSAGRSCFEASLESARLGQLGIHRLICTAQDLYRTERSIARDPQERYYLIGDRAGRWSAEQDGRCVCLAPGDLVLISSRRRYELHFSRNSDGISIELPAAWLQRWLPSTSPHLARRLDASQGWSAALCAYVRQLDPALATSLPQPANLLTDQLGALLSLTFEEFSLQDRQPSIELRDRVRDQIDERFAEPGLTAGAVAKALQISERTLHRSLASSGRTFAEWLMARRMEEAQRMLRSSAFDTLTTAAIGARVGLLDGSHFVRVYRSHLGKTPGRERTQR